MSNTNSIFQSVPLKVPSRSGFDLSHEVVTTFPGAGTLIPISCIPTLPGDKFSIGLMQQTKLPPAVTDFYGRVDVRYEAFFVANQAIWSGWNRFISRDKSHQSGVSTPGWTIPTHVPTIDFRSTASSFTDSKSVGRMFLDRQSLGDYLGLYGSGLTTSAKVNMLPFLAYHKIVDDFYIDKNIMKPFFSEGIPTGLSVSNSTPNAVAYIPSLRDTIDCYTTGDNYITGGTLDSHDKAIRGINDVALFKLRQRCWAKDIFTTCSTNPQQSSNAVAISTSGNQFTIAQLRLGNSLQKWLERNNIAGFDPSDAQLAHWGVRPSYCMQDKSVLLGATTDSVVCRGVGLTNAGVVNTGIQEPNNFAGGLFGTGGDSAGSAGSFGKNSLVDNFECHDYGYIIIMASLVPHATYSTGRPFDIWGTYEMTDFPFPEFAAIGDQPIYLNELGSYSNTYDVSQRSGASWAVHGYNQQYCRYKFMKDRCSGLFHPIDTGGYLPTQPGGDMSHMVLQWDNFTGQLGTSFLEIPTNYLDRVLNVNNAVSGFAGWTDVYLNIKALRELPSFSLPTL